MVDKDSHRRFPIRKKLLLLAFTAAIPFLAVAVYLLVSMANYSQSYSDIVSILTVANKYNLDFKEVMDESLYKMVVGYATFDNISENETLVNPYDKIRELREEFQKLKKETVDSESRVWVDSLLRNIDTLEDRIKDIEINIKDGGNYDQNIKELDDEFNKIGFKKEHDYTPHITIGRVRDVYILTDLIQDDIQHYIYYQTRNMDMVTTGLNGQVRLFLILCGGMIAVLAFGIAVIAYLISRGILRPIRELSTAAEKIAEGDLSARANVKSNDEVEDLAQGFNYMAGNIEVLLDKVREEEEKRRQTDLRLLQEQINPHFLYNTLDTIVWLIEVNEPDQAVEMVVALSDFFRLSLNKGKEFVLIQQEEQHIRSYLQIQEKRYHDIMDYEIRIDPELYEYQIPKLTLQPLVENALYHGIKYKRSKGKIEILGSRKGEEIHLYVRDNGAGMTSEELEELRREIQRPCKETEKGFGLANVNERIRMYFGETYGMKITSEKDCGTEVEVIIPLWKEGGAS